MPGGSPLAALLAKERTEQLELLLNDFPTCKPMHCVLRFFGGLKFQEIADAMPCSLNTAKHQ